MEGIMADSVMQRRCLCIQRKGVLVVQNGARRASEQEKQRMETERR
jgi:hypothetical protein